MPVKKFSGKIYLFIKNALESFDCIKLFQPKKKSKIHYTYNKHSCSHVRKDFQVPLCPLCSQPVPYKRTELPDIMMSAHIDRDCKSDPAEVKAKLLGLLYINFIDIW